MKRVQIDRGDIVLINFDPSQGDEIKGFRPALVISSKDFHQLGFMKVCPITQGNAAKARENGFSIPLNGTGCQTQGVIVVYQVRALDFRVRQVKKVESVPSYIVKEVQDILDAINHD